MCDGTPLSLTRVVTPGGSWSYSRTPTSIGASDTVTDPGSNQTVIDFSKDQNVATPTNNYYEVKRVVNQGASTALSYTYTCYNGNGVGSPSGCDTTDVTSPITRKTVFNYLPNSSGVQSETNITFFQTTSTPIIYTTQPTEEDDYDYGSGAVGSLLRKTLTTYNTTLTNNIINRPATVKVYDGSSNLVASTAYTYDQGSVTSTTGTPQHNSITGSRGNLTTLDTQASSAGTHLYRTYTYYDTGMLSTSTDVSTSSTSPGPATTYN